MSAVRAVLHFKQQTGLFKAFLFVASTRTSTCETGNMADKRFMSFRSSNPRGAIMPIGPALPVNH